MERKAEVFYKRLLEGPFLVQVHLQELLKIL